MWDLDRDPPALLRAGAHVRFVESTEHPRGDT
jgi:allophanate hydrolase subunit 1